MSWFILFIKLLHIVGGLLLVAGLIGRGIVRVRAGKVKNMHDFELLMQIAGWFESRLVIPSSNLVLILGLLSAWLRGWPLLGFLQGASSNWLLVSLVLYLTMVPMIIFIFIPRGKRFETAFQAALAQGEITSELRERFEDKVVYIAHGVELSVIAVILYLMVMKPF